MTNPYETPHVGPDQLPPEAGSKVRTFVIVGISALVAGVTAAVVGYWRARYLWSREMPPSTLAYIFVPAAVAGAIVASLICFVLVLLWRANSLQRIEFRRSEMLADLQSQRKQSSIESEQLR